MKPLYILQAIFTDIGLKGRGGSRPGLLVRQGRGGGEGLAGGLGRWEGGLEAFYHSFQLTISAHRPLLDQSCDIFQIYLSKMARVGSCASSVLELPTEMLQRIFQLLPTADLHSALQVGSLRIFKI